MVNSWITLNPPNVIRETPSEDLFLMIVIIWGIKRRALTNKQIVNPN
jgi:hypothetical protein